MSPVTQILSRIEAGESQAASELLPLVYDELRKLAADKLRHEKPGQTLQATALVHEAYLRLLSGGRESAEQSQGAHTPRSASFSNRAHFFVAAAEAMRRILIERARSRRRLKRGGDRVRLELLDQASCLDEDPDLLLSLDDVLTRLVAEDDIAARIAQLHLFGGLSVEEAGDVLGISRPVAYRNWKYARAWLRKAME
jgi:RNA polymerase sigma factor (TIGR02999 family)